MSFIALTRVKNRPMFSIINRIPLCIVGIWSSPPISGMIPPPCNGFSLTKIDNQHAVAVWGQAIYREN